MNKTLKKGKRGGETRKSFIVTESGLVETEDEPNQVRKGSVIQKIKEEPRRESHGLELEIHEGAEKMLSDLSFPNKRRQSRNLSIDHADEKFKTKSLLQKISNAKKKSDDEIMRETIQSNPVDAVDEIKASFYNKNVDTMMGYFMTTKAIAIMSSERRKRRDYGVKY